MSHPFGTAPAGENTTLEHLRAGSVIVMVFVLPLLLGSLVGPRLMTIAGHPVPSGVFIGPWSYQVCAIATSVYGYSRMRRVIWTGFVALLITAGVLWLISLTPDPSTLSTGKGFDTVLHTVPGSIMAGLGSYVIGHFVTAWLMSESKQWTQGRYPLIRLYLCPLTGIVAASAVFLTVYWRPVLPAAQFNALVITRYVVAVLYQIPCALLAWPVAKWLKNFERSDANDAGVSYNPFRLGT